MGNYEEESKNATESTENELQDKKETKPTKEDKYDVTKFVSKKIKSSIFGFEYFKNCQLVY